LQDKKKQSDLSQQEE